MEITLGHIYRWHATTEHFMYTRAGNAVNDFLRGFCQSP